MQAFHIPHYRRTQRMPLKSRSMSAMQAASAPGTSQAIEKKGEAHSQIDAHCTMTNNAARHRNGP
jgi:hypothetical protein